MRCVSRGKVRVLLLLVIKHTQYVLRDMHSPQVAYAHLASATFEKNMKLYKYRPKYHLMVHVALDLRGSIAANPMSTLALARHVVFLLIYIYLIYSYPMYPVKLEGEIFAGCP